MPELRQQLQSKLVGYTLERELGGGGMSRVFVADDAALGRKVVIKVLAPELAAGLNAERFRREILLAAQLQHPHIVPVLAAGIAGELPYFVMPFVAGESLRARLRDDAGMPIPEVVSVLRDVAKALAFAHAQGVVHRDIKPDNVLLSGGSAVMTDFGIAKAISSSLIAAPGETLTQVGTSLGTPAYMSPEQAAGDPQADARADFYSFGVMAYEMLNGRPPFYDRPAHALIMAHIAELPEPIERLVPAVPPRLATLIMRCLAKNPAERPQTAREILDELNSVDREPGTVSDPSLRSDARGTILMPAVEGPKKNVARRKVIVGIAAGVLVLVVGSVLALGMWKRSSASALDDHSLAVLPFRVASADPSLHYLREGMVDLVAAKLSGEELRAVEPRTLLDAWRSAGGSETNDLSREATLRLAQRLEAGRALLGDVVGTPNHLVLTVTLLDVPKGSQLARLTAEGPPDSLAALLNQIATQILTQTSGEGATRITSLSNVSLPALRAYLDGQARLRHGAAFAAAKDFERALNEDSTFALAGLGLSLATGWYGDPELGNRGLRLAWQARDRLSPRDRMLLTALAGEHYPQRSSNLELYRAREQYLSAASDNAEAWYLLADQVFHYGSALGISDWEDRALAGFKKAMELDSTYLPGYTHAMPLAPSLGDEEFLSRAKRLRSGADTSTYWRVMNDWYVSLRKGDTAAADSIWSRAGKKPEGFYNGIIQHTIFDGTGAAYSRRAVEALVSDAPTEATRRANSRFAHDMFQALGRPADAQRYLESSKDSTRDLNALILNVRDALMGVGDDNASTTAVRQLTAMESSEPTDSAGRASQRAITRMMETWRLAHRDTSLTRRSLARLHTIAPTLKGQDQVEVAIEGALIEAMHTDVARSPALRSSLERLDSLLLRLDFGAVQQSRLEQTVYTASRLWEKAGDPRRGLVDAGRYPSWSATSTPYLGVLLRQQGRLAGVTGNRKRAARAYRHYLALNAVSEPSRKAQVDSVRTELARVESTR